ncbi:conserved protein, unknown function [Hepatocystis sp. ex Piliocolobus tephrosceles]|nr:conserved protein, unknown function [Hepatocystis sp. ex Piliocolobus tephrosceles]
MGIESYFLKYVKVTYICKRRSEMKKTIENLKKNIETYNNYCYKCIKYYKNGEEANTSKYYSVKVDKNVENLMNIITPLNLSPNGCQSLENNTSVSSSSSSSNTSVSSSSSTSSNTSSNSSSSSSSSNTSSNSNNNNNCYILKYKINHIIGKRGKREQYRFTYLKSPFKYKYALRHYVFETYKNHFYFYNITHFNINIIFNIILSSMSKYTTVKYNLHWFYPGKNLLESNFIKTCFKQLIEKNVENNSVINNMLLDKKIKKQIKEIYSFNNTDVNNNSVTNVEKKEENKNVSHYSDINLDLNKYNIQNLLPLFFQNKIFNDNYRNLFLFEEKCFKQIKKNIRKKKLHWFLNQSA